MPRQRRKLFSTEGVKRGGRPQEQVAKANKKTNGRGVKK